MNEKALNAPNVLIYFNIIDDRYTYINFNYLEIFVVVFLKTFIHILSIILLVHIYKLFNLLLQAAVIEMEKEGQYQPKLKCIFIFIKEANNINFVPITVLLDPPPSGPLSSWPPGLNPSVAGPSGLYTPVRTAESDSQSSSLKEPLGSGPEFVRR